MPYLAIALLILLLFVPSAPASAQAPAEVWATGMRNPYRWSFDRQTGDVYVGDVGGINEEVDYIPAAGFRGANLGWNCFSGNAVQSDCMPSGNYIGPAYEYPSGPDVVIGGYVVRDPSLPSFTGHYLFGRFDSGKVIDLGVHAGQPPVDTLLNVPSISGFGEDGVGHLYATSLAGGVYRLGEDGGKLTATSIGSFNQPLSVAAPPDVADELFIALKPGLLVRWTPSGTNTVLDIRDIVQDTGEQGLLSVAVAPDYQTSGRLFIFYTDNGGDLQVEEVRGGVRTPVLTVQHDQADNHNGGQLLFGPDKALYLSTGDGGTQGDPEGDAQNPSSLLGKILRIGVNTAALPGGGLPGGSDVTAPIITTRAPHRQRVLRLGGAIVYVRSSEQCSLSAGGALLIDHRKLLLRRLRTTLTANNRARLLVRLRPRARRLLRAALRRDGHPRVVLRLRAVDGAGNHSTAVRRGVRVRR
jgi:glucose/arabinose dehydrogenase